MMTPPLIQTRSQTRNDEFAILQLYKISGKFALSPAWTLWRICICVFLYYCVFLCIIVYHCVLLCIIAPKKRILAACQGGIEPSLSLWRISDNQDWGAFSDCLTFAHNHHLSSFEPKYLQECIEMWWFLTFTPRYLQEWAGGNFSHFDRSFRKIMWK